MRDIFHQILDDLMSIVEADREPRRICIGSEAWNQLRKDRRTMHCIAVVGDKLFFQNVHIDPFCYGIDPFSVVIVSA